MLKPVVAAKGVCSPGEHMGARLGTAARGACAPHKERGAGAVCVGEGKASRRVRAADALMRIRLRCCLSEEGGERRKGGDERG